MNVIFFLSYFILRIKIFNYKNIMLKPKKELEKFLKLKYLTLTLKKSYYMNFKLLI